VFAVLCHPVLAANAGSITPADSDKPRTQATQASDKKGELFSNLENNLAAYPDGKVPCYKKFEVSFQLARKYANPFAPYPRNPVAPETERVDEFGAKADTGGVILTGVFTHPKADTVRIPAFWDGEPDGSAGTWRVRMTPTAPGEWNYRFELEDAVTPKETKGVAASLPQGKFVAVASDDRGFIRVAPGGRYFQFEDQTAFIPFGCNLVKTSDRSTIETWAKRLQAHDMNTWRVWFHPLHKIAIEWTPTGPPGYKEKMEDAPGLGRYVMSAARYMDFVVDQAEENGLYCILCQDGVGCYDPMPSGAGGKPAGDQPWHWPYNPYRSICKDGIEFFSNALAKSYYKRRLRYIAARWSYTPHVFAFELHNEIDLIYLHAVYPDHPERFKLQDLLDWHAEMADFLRKLDPYRRAVTTSTTGNALPWDTVWKGQKYDNHLSRLYEKMDFNGHHIYNKDPEYVARTAAKFAKTLPGKPLVLGEWGLGAESGADSQVSVPIGLHNVLWIELMTCGTAPLFWYWDEYYKNGGFKHCQIARQFFADEHPARDLLVPTVLETTSAEALKAQATLKTYGLCGKTRTLVWVWDLRSQQNQPDPEPVTDARVTVPELSEGKYRVRILDPWTGKTVAEQPLAHKGGPAAIALPAFRRDVALKIVPQN
jgi:hypothetical protein